MLLDTSVECTCYERQSIKSLQPVNQQMEKIQHIEQGGKGGGYPTRIRPIFFSHHASRKNKIKY